MAFALGADMVNVAREAMMSIGCIQSQKCHTDHCPTGGRHAGPVAARAASTRSSKSERAANYVVAPRRDLLKVSEAVGVAHPGLITADDVDIFDGDYAGAVAARPSTATRRAGALGRHLATSSPS